MSISLLQMLITAPKRGKRDKFAYIPEKHCLITLTKFSVKVIGIRDKKKQNKTKQNKTKQNKTKREHKTFVFS